MDQIKVNGDLIDIQNGLTLVGLLEHFKLQSKKVAIELNRKIIPKSEYNTTKLNDNDTLELVHFIGGG
jgi:sulfur carrier protein